MAESVDDHGEAAQSTIDEPYREAFEDGHKQGYAEGYTAGIEAVKAYLAGIPIHVGITVSLEAPIEELGLSIRTYNCLQRGGIFTIGALIEKSECDLLELRNIGVKAIGEVKDKLSRCGYVLSPSPYSFKLPR